MANDSFTKSPQEPKLPPLTTAVLLMLPDNGESCIIERRLDNLETSRTASLDDVYRIVCDVKAQIESMRTVTHHFAKMRAMSAEIMKKQSEIVKG